MKDVHRKTTSAVVALACIFAVSCGDSDNEQRAAELNKCTGVGFQNTDELKAYSQDHVGSRLAVVIGNQVITQHKIREPLVSEQVRVSFCTVGSGDHLQQHLQRLKLASDENRTTEAGLD